MAVICPQCKTKNRSAAKFCIECIGTLPTAFAESNFPATVRSTAPAGPAIGAAAAPFSKGLWVSIAGLSVALLIGAAGWLVAGAGGWYFYTAGKAQVHPARTEASNEAVAPAVPVPVIAAPEPAPEPAAISAVEKAMPSDAPAPKAAAKPRAVRTGTASEPASACANMNLIAASRCMAAQCLKAEFKPHPQCEAVRRQQQLEEQKRNPAAP
jgi:hypothetical protein